MIADHKRFLRPLGLLLVAVTLLTACSRHKSFRLLSGSENEPLQPLIKEFAETLGYEIEFAYKGSVDIMHELQSDSGASAYFGFLYARRGQEPLYVIYPTDGLDIADSQPGYVDQQDKDKEAYFKRLQDYLTSPEVQAKLLQLGRRTGFAGELPNAPADGLTRGYLFDGKKDLVTAFRKAKGYN